MQSSKSHKVRNKCNNYKHNKHPIFLQDLVTMKNYNGMKMIWSNNLKNKTKLRKHHNHNNRPSNQLVLDNNHNHKLCNHKLYNHNKWCHHKCNNSWCNKHNSINNQWYSNQWCNNPWFSNQWCNNQWFNNPWHRAHSINSMIWMNEWNCERWVIDSFFLFIQNKRHRYTRYLQRIL